jgi:hypothetical protein
MPTANANTGNGFAKAISYALQETKKYPEETRAKLLELNQVYGSSREMGKQMREVADERKTTQKPVLHVQINFHPDEKLSQAQAETVIDSILKDIGIKKDNHQYVVVQHKDKAHDHYHVVANRVGLDGELLNDHRIKDRLQVACDKVEKEQDLRQTQNRTVTYDPSQERGFRYATAGERQINKQQKQNKPVRDKNSKIMEQTNEIRDQLQIVLSTKKMDSPEKLKAELAKRGVDVQFSENKKGISGISFKKDNISVKGSAIDYKWSDLSKVLEKNKDKAEELTKVEPQASKPTLAAKKKGLQPTPEEKKDYDFVKDYNPRVENAIREIKEELERGNIDVNVFAIMERNGFKEEKDRFTYSNGVLKSSIHKTNIKQPIKDVKEQFEWFKDSEKQYSELMQQQPKKITVFDKLTGAAKEKEITNSSLQKAKREAIKPEFKPQVHGMQTRDFTLTSKFENREYEYKRQEQLKEMFSNKNEQDQSRKNGLRR